MGKGVEGPLPSRSGSGFSGAWRGVPKSIGMGSFFSLSDTRLGAAVRRGQALLDLKIPSGGEEGAGCERWELPAPDSTRMGSWGILLDTHLLARAMQILEAQGRFNTVDLCLFTTSTSEYSPIKQGSCERS